MNENLQLALVAAIPMFMLLGVVATLSMFYKKVPQGKAWIRSGIGGPRISFGGILCIPVLHKLEQVDVTAKKVDLRHFDDHIIKTKDGVELNAQVGIMLRIEPTAENVLFAAQTHGTAILSDQEHIERLFRDRFEEGLVASVRQFTWNEIDASLEPLKAEYFRRINEKSLGFIIDDISFGHLSKPSEFTEQRVSDKSKIYHN